MLRPLAFLCSLAALAGCATPIDEPDGLVVRTVRMSEAARLAGLEVTPTALIEDSRCPTGVQCIQAGTVRIEARILDPGGARSATLALGVPAALDSGWVSLVAACPHPVHGRRIAPGDYRFSLALTTRDSPPLIDAAPCPTG